MQVQVFGQWALIAVGILLAALGGWVVLKDRAFKSKYPFVLCIMAIGIGAFGLPFLEKFNPYTKLLEGLIGAQDVAAYSSFFDEVAGGNLAEGVAEAGVAFTLERPLPGMEEALDRAISKAGSGWPKTLLVQTKRDLIAKRTAAQEIVEGAASAGTAAGPRLQKYDSALQRLMVADLQKLPAQQKAQMQVDQNLLSSMANAGKKPKKLGPTP